MALPLTKVPNDFPFKHSGQPDKYGQSLGGDFAQVQADFDSRAEYNQTQINAIITALKSIADGDSGADNVNATSISGLSATTVQGLLEELKTLVDTQLPTPDGSITNNKLATDIKVGSLASLLTTVKTSVVGAINELFNNKANLTNPTFTNNINLTTINSKTPSYSVTPTEISITTGFASGWSGSIKYRKNQENQTTLILSLVNNTDIVAGLTLLYTLPVAIRPLVDIKTTINLYAAAQYSIANSFANIIILTSGEIYVYPVTGTTLTDARLIYAVTFTYY